MKRLLPGIIIVLFIASCGEKTNNSKNLKTDSLQSKAQVKQPLIPGFTLNGVDQNKATKMIANFETDYPADLNTTKTVSVWYGINEIKAMNNLLVREYQQNQRPDGVRIYFGCDNPATGAGTKLTPVIFLVSTQQRNPVVAGKSNHEDYYDHLSGVLPGGELGGAPIYDANDAFTKGALLYSPTTPADIPCNAAPSQHYINGADAYQAVRRHTGGSQQNDVSVYNTRAEWFDLCFINSVFNAILDENNNLNGLRIYLGKRTMENDGKDRDVFILVPTKDVGGIATDTYQCLEDLKSFSCTYTWTNVLTDDKKHNAHLSFMKVAGYDKGELCPFNCN